MYYNRNDDNIIDSFISSALSYKVLRNEGDYPIIKYGLMTDYPIDNYIYNYMRKHIYPVNAILHTTQYNIMSNIYSNKCQIGFISEEYLIRNITRDCRIFNKMYGNTILASASTSTSAIGTAYYEYMYIITHNSDTTNHIEDIWNETIGICTDDMYYFAKFLSLHNIQNANISLTQYPTLTEAVTKFKSHDINVIFAMSNQRNTDILDLSRTQQIKFIPPSETIFSKLHHYLISAKLITTDLSTFYSSANTNIYARKMYRTIGIRTILMLNDTSMKPAAVEYLVSNYIAELDNIRDYIQIIMTDKKRNNDISVDLQRLSLVDMDRLIPLNNVAKRIYCSIGLIKIENVIQCKSIIAV